MDREFQGVIEIFFRIALRGIGRQTAQFYFEIMVETGMRVGEVTGLRREDVDFNADLISVNHTLVYYGHRRDGKNSCYFNVHPTKTRVSEKSTRIT